MLYTAHHDHLGTRTPPVPGERNVYAGAVDNASGCPGPCGRPPRPRRVTPATLDCGGLRECSRARSAPGRTGTRRTPRVRAGRIAAVINVDGISVHGRTQDARFLGGGKVEPGRDCQGARRRSGPDRALAIPTPTGVASTIPTDFELTRVGVPTARVRGGPRYVGRPEGWGREQSESTQRRDYHQPSDVYPASPEAWDLQRCRGGRAAPAAHRIAHGER